MYLADLTQAAFEALRSSKPLEKRLVDQEEAHRIRMRILGVIIRQGRLAATYTLEECAQLLGADAQLIESWELGRSMPSLPQLEALSVCFNAPRLDDPSGEIRLPRPAGEEYLRIRQRIVGVLLQSARQAREFTVADLGALTGIDADILTQYEIGESTIPVHHLTILAQAVRQELSFFSEPGDEKFSTMRATAPIAPAAKNEDEEIATFAADGRNRAFIRLAMAFREIDREDLYRLASALLAIIREKRDSNGRPPA